MVGRQNRDLAVAAVDVPRVTPDPSACDGFHFLRPSSAKQADRTRRSKRSASRAPNETVCEKGEERPGSVSAVIDVEEASTVVSVKNTCGHEEKSLPHIAFTAPNIQSKILSTLLRIGCT